MKHFLPLLVGCAVAALHPASADTYNGNGNTGFGGGLGLGMLSIAASGDTLNFALTTGGGQTLGQNSVALYIDSIPDGDHDTSTYTDYADGGRVALSGYSPSTNNGVGSRTLLTFPANFKADFGLSIEASYAGLFNLSNPTNFTYIDGMVPTATALTNGNTLYTFAITLSDLGLTPTGSFNFVGSLISSSAYRSDETLGMSTTTPDAAGGTGTNAGFNGSQTLSSFDTFPAVPEPGSLACLGLGAVALAGFAARRAKPAPAA